MNGKVNCIIKNNLPICLVEADLRFVYDITLATYSTFNWSPMSWFECMYSTRLLYCNIWHYSVSCQWVNCAQRENWAGKPGPSSTYSVGSTPLTSPLQHHTAMDKLTSVLYLKIGHSVPVIREMPLRWPHIPLLNRIVAISGFTGWGLRYCSPIHWLPPVLQSRWVYSLHRCWRERGW